MLITLGFNLNWENHFNNKIICVLQHQILLSDYMEIFINCFSVITLLIWSAVELVEWYLWMLITSLWRNKFLISQRKICVFDKIMRISTISFGVFNTKNILCIMKLYQYKENKYAKPARLFTFGPRITTFVTDLGQRKLYKIFFRISNESFAKSDFYNKLRRFCEKSGCGFIFHTGYNLLFACWTISLNVY